MMFSTSLLLNISKFNTPFLFFSQPVRSSSSTSTFCIPLSLSMAMPTPHTTSTSTSTKTTRIAIVGDVHDEWDLEADAKALQFLQPDLVLFTGDFGNENVELVRSISELKMAKAVILGNHDCVFTRQFSQKMKDGVQLQLECLGGDHVGYKRLDFPDLKFSLVGGRPFSHGGKRMNRKELLAVRYGVHNTEKSAERICAAARGAPENHFLIFLAHNGPTGLGSNMDDICGKDWVHGGGDHGDAGPGGPAGVGGVSEEAEAADIFATGGRGGSTTLSAFRTGAGAGNGDGACDDTSSKLPGCPTGISYGTWGRRESAHGVPTIFHEKTKKPKKSLRACG